MDGTHAFEPSTAQVAPGSGRTPIENERQNFAWWWIATRGPKEDIPWDEPAYFAPGTRQRMTWQRWCSTNALSRPQAMPDDIRSQTRDEPGRLKLREQIVSEKESKKEGKQATRVSARRAHEELKLAWYWISTHGTKHEVPWEDEDFFVADNLKRQTYLAWCNDHKRDFPQHLEVDIRIRASNEAGREQLAKEFADFAQENNDREEEAEEEEHDVKHTNFAWYWIATRGPEIEVPWQEEKYFTGSTNERNVLLNWCRRNTDLLPVHMSGDIRERVGDFAGRRAIYKDIMAKRRRLVKPQSKEKKGRQEGSDPWQTALRPQLRHRISQARGNARPPTYQINAWAHTHGVSDLTGNELYDIVKVKNDVQFAEWCDTDLKARETAANALRVAANAERSRASRRMHNGANAVAVQDGADHSEPEGLRDRSNALDLQTFPISAATPRTPEHGDGLERSTSSDPDKAFVPVPRTHKRPQSHSPSQSPPPSRFQPPPLPSWVLHSPRNGIEYGSEALAPPDNFLENAGFDMSGSRSPTPSLSVAKVLKRGNDFLRWRRYKAARLDSILRSGLNTSGRL